MNFKKLALVAGLTVCVSQVFAANYSDEYSKQIKSAEVVGALGPDMFGDQTSFYTGATSFETTDVSLPGNFALPVSVSRRYRIEMIGELGNHTPGIFGNWDLSIPHLEGVFRSTWESGSGTALRCADTSVPPTKTYQGTSFGGNEYWSGNSLVLPGGSSQEMLRVITANPNKPTSGGPYYWVTNNNWYFSCLETAKNSTGQAFLAIAPDGTKYTFDWFADRAAPTLYKTAMSPAMGFAEASASSDQLSTESSVDSGVSTMAYDGGILTRREVWILPSHIEDRFGNSVDYTYDAANPMRLTKIQASDQRTINLTYTGNSVSSINDGTRTWTYGYGPHGLASVTLPDGSAWGYDFGQFDNIYYDTWDPGFCDGAQFNTFVPGPATGTVTHPSGAVGEFTVQPLLHGRSYVSNNCQQIMEGDWYSTYAKRYVAISLISKRITGPGLVAAQWDYTYGPTNDSFSTQCTPSCPDTKTVEVVGPEGFTRYTFGNHFQTTEGKLLTVQQGASSTNILRTETNSYAIGLTGQPYPDRVGDAPWSRSDRTNERNAPLKTRAIALQNVTFTRQVNSFDAYVNPVTVARSSSGAGVSFSRSETTSYHHNTAKWVIGQVASVTDGATNKVMSSSTFDADTALPLTTSKFGVLQQTMTYNGNGTLATVKDGRNNIVTLSSWNRGVPQRIDYPTTNCAPDPNCYESAVVNPIGTIASTSDELHFVHSYGYDGMGRLASIAYPTADTTTWNSTTRNFTKVASTEYGLPAGHWKQVVSTGNGRVTTFYDGRWQPVLVLTEDTGNAASKSFVVNRYDAAGRKTFTSYPVGTLTSVNDGTLKGVTTEYDALSRVTKTMQDSELGVLTTTTAYLNGFQTRVTNPRNVQTTTSYQVFDEPSTESPVKIIQGVGLPEGHTTTITRDGFGKPLSITRGAGS